MAQRVGAQLSGLSGVRAIVLGGSLAGGWGDPSSDIDLYVYADQIPPAEDRRRVADGGREIEIDNRFWETGDEWVDGASGIGIDVIYRSPAWVEGELDRVLVRHEASVGYSTAIWANVAAGVPLSDPSGWYGDLLRRASVPYPEPLRAAIVAKNLPLLWSAHGAYRGQIAKAISRNDAISVNHRVAAHLASVCDIIFALNRVPHPGEKQQLAIIEATCPIRPEGFATDVGSVLAASGEAGQPLLRAVDRLVAGIVGLVAESQRSDDRLPVGDGIAHLRESLAGVGPR